MSWTTDIKFTKGSYAISWSSLHTHRFLSSRHEIQLIKLQFYSASKVTFRPMKVWETLTHIKSMLFLPFLANYLIFMWVHVKSLQSCLTLCDPMDCSLPGSSVFLGFSRQEYWGGLWFPSPGDLPDPGIEPTASAAPALAGGFFTTAPPGSPQMQYKQKQMNLTVCQMSNIITLWWQWQGRRMA